MTRGWTESSYWALVRASLQACGAEAFKLHGHLMQRPGWPDCRWEHRIWSGWVELKVGAALSEQQEGVIRRLQRARSPVLILRGAKTGRGRADVLHEFQRTDGTTLEELRSEGGTWPAAAGDEGDNALGRALLHAAARAWGRQLAELEAAEVRREGR